MAYSLANQLPDPNYKRGWWGAAADSGDVGPGFASVKLVNDHKMMLSRTNAQRVIARAVAGQKWKININYNPMTRAEFEPVYSFLLQQKGPLTPFFVSLPQYRTPQNTDWNTVVTSTYNHDGDDGTTAELNTYLIQTVQASTAGSSTLTLHIEKNTSGTNNAAEYDPATGGTNLPAPGDMINISGQNKAHLITMVETDTANSDNTITNTNYSGIYTRVIRLTVSPALTAAVADNTAITFSQPLVKVIMPQPIQEYSLNTDNLYSFNLKLEEHI